MSENGSGLAALHEAYLRADQEWRIEVSRARLNHADLSEDLRAAQADLDCEDLLRDRLEKLIALENARADRQDLADAMAEAVRMSHETNTALARGLLPQPMRASLEDAMRAEKDAD